jgi:hypothetical protein
MMKDMLIKKNSNRFNYWKKNNFGNLHFSEIVAGALEIHRHR